jgi:hypothetical protein
MPGDSSHVAARIQIHHWDPSNPRAKAAITAANQGLRMLGKKSVATYPVPDIRFKNGAAPVRSRSIWSADQ